MNLISTNLFTNLSTSSLDKVGDKSKSNVSGIIKTAKLQFLIDNYIYRVAKLARWSHFVNRGRKSITISLSSQRLLTHVHYVSKNFRALSFTSEIVKIVLEKYKCGIRRLFIK